VESINQHRLPRSVAPTEYQIRLRPDIAAASFSGSVTIAATAHQPVSEIVLNAIELNIHAAVVRQGGNEQLAVITMDETAERLHLQLQDAIAPGDLEIDITFDGILNDKLRGFYRSSFTDDDGVEHTIATTQFESTNARRCFPCWDEPDRKAVFSVTLEVPQDMLAISAMVETGRTQLDERWVQVNYAPTPLMSTYLLAFMVGDMEASPAIDVDGVPVRIIHRPGQGDQISFAHDAAVFCLRWVTDYFGVPYFGDKIDLLAIPDFAFGAMENTGCVTFREVLLLVDPESTTQPEQQRSVAVIAHELAHMWFGNLVTMQWWEGLWLKEAFATFMETSATDAYRPDWKVWEGFALDRSSAYHVDCLHSTRAIEFVVESPADAEGMYDVLTYEKGAAVVRMLEQFVGADQFRDGIRSYMTTHAYRNTVTADLWNAIGSATELPVEHIMQEWIYQGGFPLIEASLGDGELELDQQIFRLLDKTNAPATNDWDVPLTVQVDGIDSRVLMAPQARIPLSDTSNPVIVDPHSHGFFRVRYDDALSQRLTAQLMDLTGGQRHRLFDDQFDLVLAGHLSVADYLSLAGALNGETSRPVWATVSGGFSTLAHATGTRSEHAKIGEIWSSIAQPQLRALGFERPKDEDDPLTNEVRASLYSSLGSLSHDDAVMSHARQIFDGTVETTNASLEAAAIGVIASTGSRNDYDEVFHRFQKATSPQAERRYLFALSRFDDAEAIADLCDRTMDGSIRSQDAAFVLGLTISNRWHGEQAWSFVTTNWDRISATVPDNAVGRMLGGVEWLEHSDVPAVHAFLDGHEVPQAKLSILQHRERLDIHLALARRIGTEVAAL
jgi:puromycin-sensitive aminopeptidase